MNTNCTASKRKLRLYKIIIPAAVSFAFLISLLALHAFGGVFYPGDVNVDKSIDVSDAVLLSRFCAEDPNAMISRQGMTNADANQDQTIDDQDSLHILRMIAKQVPMPPNPYIETAPGMETTSAETETTSVESTVSTATVTTTVSISETEPAQPEISDFTADQTQYPLGVSISVLSGKTEPNEMLTVNYEIGNIIFAIFANDPKNKTVAIAYQDDIVGYY
ncbi:MAG: dockerin type I repeat-containing protein, partial [Oscillospiraceae bacterium]|nr:dockerin type I repeat-containing protein [Oscillospiraceae bacterium]